MCIPNLEYQLVNPTTQVALYSFCLRSCPTLLNITWNIYQGLTNLSSNVTQWTFFNANQSLENRWFFGTRFLALSVGLVAALFYHAGRSSPNFTSISQLFVSFPRVELWRFEVVYSFTNQQSRSALNFRINRPPTNGSCSVSPQNGTTTTRFTISCPNWLDDDQIKDYSLYRKTTIGWTFVSYSSVQTFDVFFPSGDHQLLVSVRDKRDCVTESNLTTISVRTASANLSSSSSLGQILQIGDPAAKAQVINLISQEMNEDNLESLRNASSSQGRWKIDAFHFLR